MFDNFKWSEFTWRREPVLIITLIVAVLQVVAAIISGSVEWPDGAETIVTLIFGFIVRGQVTPV